MLRNESIRLNRKKERDKFVPADLSILLNEGLLNLATDELPQNNRTEFTTVAYLVPITRQFIMFANLKLAAAQNLVTKNIRFYDRYLNIHLKLKDQLDPQTMNPEKLKR